MLYIIRFHNLWNDEFYPLISGMICKKKTLKINEKVRQYSTEMQQLPIRYCVGPCDDIFTVWYRSMTPATNKVNLNIVEEINSNAC